MKREILEKIFDRLFRGAQKIIERDHQQHSPMLFSINLKNEEAAEIRVGLLSGDRDFDGAIIKTIAQMCPPNVVAVHVDEVWGKFALDGSPLPDPEKHEGVKNMPGSKEGVLFNFFGRDWEACAFCEIKRNPDKLLRGEIYTNYTSEGRLAPHG